jgi:hypothetical protein
MAERNSKSAGSGRGGVGKTGKRAIIDVGDRPTGKDPDKDSDREDEDPDAKGDDARLAAVRELVEAALLGAARVGLAAVGAEYCEILRACMPCLSNETLAFFAQSQKRLVLLLGKGENENECAMEGRGGSTAQAVGFTQAAAAAAMDASVGIFDMSPFYSVGSAGSAGGRNTDYVSVHEQRFMEIVLGVLIAAARACGNKFVLASTMLGGSKRCLYECDFSLLRDEVDAALKECRGVVKDEHGRQIVEGGPHWSVCWARTGAGAELLRFLQEVALARFAGAGAPSEAQTKAAKALLLRAAAAGRDKADSSRRRFAPLIAIALGEEAAELVALGTDEANEEAAALITGEATARMLEDVPGAANLVELLARALVDYAVPAAGAALRTGPPLGGFVTTLVASSNFASFMTGLQADAAPSGARGVPFPSSMGVIAADLVTSMQEKEQVFSPIYKYALYRAKIFVQGRDNRVYAGSAGRNGLDFLAAYEKRTDERNGAIKNHAGVGDSNLGIYVAKLRVEVTAGTLSESAVDIEVSLLGFSVPEGALPEALGGAHALGLFAEQLAIIALWPYKACLNASPVALKIEMGFDSASGAAAGEL